MKKSDLKLITVDDIDPRSGIETNILRMTMPPFVDEEVFGKGFHEYGGMFQTREELFNFMMDKMIEYHGIGLSAPQMGLPFRMFVMGRKGFNHAFAGFNPKALSVSENREEADESCLSIPGIKVLVDRADSVYVQYSDVTGKQVERMFTGIYARIFQHEMNHLHGILITDIGEARAEKRETTNTYR